MTEGARACGLGLIDSAPIGCATGRACAAAGRLLAAAALAGALCACAGSSRQRGPAPYYAMPTPAAVARATNDALAQAECLPVTVDKKGKATEPAAYLATLDRYRKRVVLQRRADVDRFYPPREQSWRIEGFALVQFDVETNGAVTNPHVLLTSPLNTFEAASISVLMASRFSPIEPRCSRVVEQIAFRLH
jgi:TonB family protein